MDNVYLLAFGILILGMVVMIVLVGMKILAGLFKMILELAIVAVVLFAAWSVLVNFIEKDVQEEPIVIIQKEELPPTDEFILLDSLDEN